MAVDQDLFYLPAIPDHLFQQVPEQYTLLNNITIKAGELKPALQHTYLNKAGFVRFAYASFNSPYASIKIVYDGREVKGNVYELYEAGMTQSQPGIPYVTKYDNSGLNYVVAWEPQRSFTKNVSMYFGNESALYGASQTVKLQGFISDIYIWNRGFYEALAKVKAGETLKEYSSP